MLDAWTALGYLADRSTRLRLGPLVSPLSFRDPVILARQAMDLDDLSGGRFVLGVGTGWIEREHRMFGWDLGDVKSRMDRLAEGFEVIAHLCRSDEPVTFEGRFYTLREAKLLPHTARPNGPDLMVGSNSGGRRSLALAARYADVWNVGRKPLERWEEIARDLDARLASRGRPPSAVRGTMQACVLPWRTEAELERRAGVLLAYVNPEGLGPRAYAEARRALGDFVGTPGEIVDQLHAAAGAGVQEVMVDTFDLEDLEVLEVIATEVMPHL
jgi:alkanesulfonate monooxygenase SsuD/methylene tetrahydromethanopterin reductase-like flavin-dependent oxidoreductase (luciferase family)